MQILCLLRHYPVVGIANVASSERVEKKNHSIGVLPRKSETEACLGSSLESEPPNAGSSLPLRD